MIKQLSDAQLAANRANAQKSTGPRTEEGKARSSQNATTHGLYSQHSDILDGECREEFNRLRDDYYARFKPVDNLEDQLVYNMVMAEWHIRRYRIAENSILQMGVIQCGNSENTGCFRLAEAIQELGSKPYANFINRTLTRLTRELAQMLKNFWAIRKNIPTPPAEPSTPNPVEQRNEENEPKQASQSEPPREPRAFNFNWIPIMRKAMAAGAA